jgi:hypothetical protein
VTASDVLHGWQRSYGGCRCDVCREGVRVRTAERRASRRGLTPVPPAPSNRQYVADSPGPCVAAVRRDLDGLGDLAGWEYLAAGALAMARILDSGGNVPTWPAAAKQLMASMAALHKEAAPKRGWLAEVQKMSSRPDAGTVSRRPQPSSRRGSRQSSGS